MLSCFLVHNIYIGRE